MFIVESMFVRYVRCECVVFDIKKLYTLLSPAELVNTLGLIKLDQFSSAHPANIKQILIKRVCDCKTED